MIFLEKVFHALFAGLIALGFYHNLRYETCTIIHGMPELVLGIPPDKSIVIRITAPSPRLGRGPQFLRPNSPFVGEGEY